MQRRELHFEKTAYEAHMAEYEKTAKVLNDYYNLVKKLIQANFSKTEADKRINSIDAAKAKFELFTGNWQGGDQLREHVKSLVYDLLATDDTLNGMKVNKEKAFELLELPEDKINSIVEFIRANAILNDPEINFQIDIGKFKIQNGKVTAIFEKELKEQYTIYAENEKELRLYNSAVTMAQELEKLHKEGAIETDKLREMPFIQLEQGNPAEKLQYNINFNFVKQ